DPGIRARLTASPGLSQFSTPFVASWRQDIPHMPLGAWPHGSAPRRLGSPPGSRSPSPVPDRRLVGTSNYRSSSLGLMQRLSKQGDAARGFLDDAAVLVRQLLPLPNCQRTNRRPTAIPGELLLDCHSDRRGSRKRATANHPLNRSRGFALRKTPRNPDFIGPSHGDNPKNRCFRDSRYPTAGPIVFW